MIASVGKRHAVIDVVVGPAAVSAGAQDVTAALYDELRDGDSTLAQYLRSDPGTNRIDRDFPRRQLVIYASVLWLPFAVAAFFALRRRRDA